MEETIIKLQTIAQHQEQEIAQLSAELYTQQKEIGKLKQQMAAMIERLRSFSEAMDGQDKSPEPPPPHY
jgi:uncharacterized coiled-coil protein SlyX